MSTLAAFEDRVPPLAGLGVAVVAVSTSAILVRASAAPAPVAAFYRVAFTVVLLLPFARGLGARVAAVGGRDLLAAVAAGAALAAHFAAWFASVDLTSVAASVTLVQTQPAFVAVGAAVLLDERLTRRTAAGIAAAIAGVAVVSFGGVEGAPAGAGATVGNALAVAGAVAAAGYVLAGRSLRQRVALVPYVIVVYAACAVALLGFSLARGHALVGYPSREWALFVGMAAGPGVLGHTVVNWALKYLESRVVSVSLVAEPVGSSILAAAVFGEIPGAATVAGGALVLAGIAVTVAARPERT